MLLLPPPNLPYINNQQPHYLSCTSITPTWRRAVAAVSEIRDKIPLSWRSLLFSNFHMLYLAAKLYLFGECWSCIFFKWGAFAIVNKICGVFAMCNASTTPPRFGCAYVIPQEYISGGMTSMETKLGLGIPTYFQALHLAWGIARCGFTRFRRSIFILRAFILRIA